MGIITTKIPYNLLRGRIGVADIINYRINTTRTRTSLGILLHHIRDLQEQIAVIQDALPHANPDTDAELRRQLAILQHNLDQAYSRIPARARARQRQILARAQFRAQPPRPGPRLPVPVDDKPIPIDAPEEELRCDCKSWKYADWMWANNLIDKDLWRAALKAPQKSGYDLWMKESVTAANRGHYYPDAPSVSGGYSTLKIIPGIHFQPPVTCCKQLGAIHNTQYSEPAPHRWELYVWTHTRDPRKPTLRIDTKFLTLYANGWDQPASHSEAVPDPWEVVYFAGVDTPQLCLEIQATTSDGITSYARYLATKFLSHFASLAPSATHHCRGPWPKEIQPR
jgi:hypothetical protein